MKRLICIFVLVLGIFVLAAQPVSAIGRRVCGVNACAAVVVPNVVHEVVTPAVVAVPVPFVVNVPSVSYLFNGSAVYGQAAFQPVQYPQPNVQPSVQPNTQAFTDAQIDALIDRIEQRLKERIAKEAEKQPATTAAPPAVPQLSSDVATLLSTPTGRSGKSCVDCHTGSTSKGGTMIFLADGRLNPRVDKAKVYKSVFDMTMPKTAEKDQTAVWSDDMVEKLRVAWNLPAN